MKRDFPVIFFFFFSLQMNEILGDDYEKKLAAVSVLKQYAEDRDIATLAKALCFILKTPKQRQLIDYIRYVLPTFSLQGLSF